MKTNARLILGITLIAAFAFSGCGKSDSTVPAKSAASETTAASGTAPSGAAGRVIEITANDTMKFSVTEIRAKPGEALAVTLVNRGTMPKSSMGHNWVLLAAGIDLDAFTNATVMAATTDYIPASYKEQIIASTKLLGPKEKDTIEFNAPTKPGRYPFVCSFPGHTQIGMKGDLIVE